MISILQKLRQTLWIPNTTPVIMLAVETQGFRVYVEKKKKGNAPSGIVEPLALIFCQSVPPFAFGTTQ